MKHNILFVYLYFLLISMAIGIMFVWLAKKLSFRWKVLDIPDGKRKKHSIPIPLLGGLAIFSTLLLVTIIHVIGAYFISVYCCNWELTINIPYYFNNLMESPSVYLRLAAIFIGGVLIFLVGLYDDIKGASIRWRLISEFLIATLVVVFGVQPELSFLPKFVVWIITILWIVTITNAFNFIDGLDGLCAGVGAISVAILCYVTVLNNQPMVALLLFTMLGAILAFLRSNFFPAKIYLGSSGSMLIGYMLAAVVLVMTFMKTHSNNIFPIIMPLLIFGIPVFDLVSVVTIRLFEGRSPFRGDRSHLAHRLVRIGFTPKQAVLFVYLIAFAVGVDALYIPELSEFESVVVLVHTLALFGIIVVLERVRAPKQEAEEER